MYGVIAQAGALIAIGVVWRRLRPLGLEADNVRPALTGLVYIVLLPALVLSVLWGADLGLDTLRLAVVAAACVLAGLFLGWAACRLLRVPAAAAGALILAAGFGNFTYLGLPLLEASFGAWGREVAIQFDLFAATPLLLTLGVAIAAAHGHGRREEGPVAAVARVPALWAAAVGVALNLGGVPAAEWPVGLLETLAAGVVPLMLISTGLALQGVAGWQQRLGQVAPVLAIRLALVPLGVAWLAAVVGLDGELWRATVIESAMPSMVIGLVIAERYGLDTRLYAEAVTVSTAAAAITLPLWFAGLGGWL